MENKKIKNIKEVNSKYKDFIPEIDELKAKGLTVKQIREHLRNTYKDFIAENIMKRYRKFKRQIKAGILAE